MSGLEVRIHTKEEVELSLLAREDGMGVADAAAFAAVSRGAARRWVERALPRGYTGMPWGSGGIDGGNARTRRGGAAVDHEAGACTTGPRRVRRLA